MKRKLVRIVAMVAISIGGVLWASPAFAYGPGATTISTNISTVGAGGSLIVTGSGFQPGETITLVLHSTPVTLGTTPADSQGSFSTTVTIPADTTPGNHTIIATGNTSGSTASTSIVVVSATTSGGTSTSGSSGGGLAFTGAHIAAMAGVGAIALALGGMLVFAGRRRRITSSQS
jgi:hypothetical protein